MSGVGVGEDHAKNRNIVEERKEKGSLDAFGFV
jgi:hypothetical protein